MTNEPKLSVQAQENCERCSSFFDETRESLQVWDNFILDRSQIDLVRDCIKLSEQIAEIINENRWRVTIAWISDIIKSIVIERYWIKVNDKWEPIYSFDKNTKKWTFEFNEGSTQNANIVSPDEYANPVMEMSWWVWSNFNIRISTSFAVCDEKWRTLLVNRPNVDTRIENSLASADILWSVGFNSSSNSRKMPWSDKAYIQRAELTNNIALEVVNWNLVLMTSFKLMINSRVLDELQKEWANKLMTVDLKELGKMKSTLTSKLLAALWDNIVINLTGISVIAWLISKSA